MTQRSTATLMLSLAAAPTLANPVASTETPVFSAPVVTVSATRTEQDAREVNRPVVVLDQQALDQRQPRSVPEALSDTPGVTTTGGPRPGSQEVNIRGLQGQRVLQTVDGVRQVFESGHRPNYFLDPALLRSVEVIKGPASALWGSGALGGVVAQNTIAATDLLTADATLGGLLKTGYNNNSDELNGVAALAGRRGQVDWLVGGYHRDANEIELGNGDTLEASAIRNSGGLAKLDWQLNDHHAITISARNARADGSVPSNGTAAINGTSNFVIRRAQENTNLLVDYRFDTESERVDGQLLAYTNDVDMDERRLSDGRADSTSLSSRGVSLNNRSMFGSVAVFYGMDGYEESFRAERSGANRPTPPDAESDVAGAFVHASVPVTSQWQAAAGVRYDHFATEARNLGVDRSENALSPSAALTWVPSSSGRVTLRHDRAFRAPGAEEMYSTGTHFCMGPFFCNTFVANPDLKPEQAANNELLGSWRFDNLAGEDQLTLSGAVFENHIDNFIEQIVESPSFAPPPADPGNTYWVNVDKATISGFELSALYQRARMALVLGYAQTRGENDRSGEDLTNIPADTLSADISYRFEQAPVHAGIRVTHADAQNRTDYAENSAATRYRGYTITDLYASWSPAQSLRIDLTANNLNDREYRTAWSQLDNPGREVIVSMQYNF